MQRAKLPFSNGLTVVAHATSTRRLAAMVEHESLRQDNIINPIFRMPTDYLFNPESPIDQQESVAELIRLADWPAKDWLQSQIDLPEDLVEFARDSMK